MNDPTWQHFQYYRELGVKEECTCPACHVVWVHHDSPEWLQAHYGSRTEPVECSECGTRSVANPGKRMGPRKLYVEPEPAQTRVERQRRGWFGRAREVSHDHDYQR